MWIDKLIGFLSPKAGFERQEYRRALDLQRGYEAAKNSRRTSGWQAGGGSANAEVVPAIGTLRNRSRESVRNNAYGASAVDGWVANVIGTGIVANWKNKRLNKTWKKWVKECDADGKHDFYGLQALAARTEFESGEVLVRFRWRKKSDGLSVPLQLQVLEPDFLDTNKNEDLPNGGYIIAGIEFSSIGKVVQFWMFDRHPGEHHLNLRSWASKPVPASELLLCFEVKRPGQVRGAPRLAPVLMELRDLADYQDAELMRKKVEACFSAIITSDRTSSSLGMTSGDGKDSTGRKIERLAPGTMAYLRPGEDVQFANPSQNTSYEAFVRDRRRTVATAARVTYEQMTGDYSQVTYLSSRAAQINVRRKEDQWTWLMFIPQFCDPIAQAFLMAAELAGILGVNSDYEAVWTPPRREWVDPIKDVEGEVSEIRAGLKTWSAAVRGRGEDPEEQIQALKKDSDDLAKAGIKLDFGSKVPIPQPVNNDPSAAPKEALPTDTSDTEDPAENPAQPTEAS